MMPSMQFCITQPNGGFVCLAKGLLFEGNVLAYDPTSNEEDLVPMPDMADDLSQAQDTSVRELSNMVPLDSTEEAQRLE